MIPHKNSPSYIAALVTVFVVAAVGVSHAAVRPSEASGGPVEAQTYTSPPMPSQSPSERDTYTVIDTRYDGIAAADKMLTWTTYRSGYCMEAVWTAFGNPTPDAPGSYPMARSGWERTPEQFRHYDRVPPKGAIVYFHNTANPSAAGHIAISVGGGYIVSTDKPGPGQVGLVSISEIENSWGGRTYLGWTDYFMGNPVKTDK